VRVAETSALTGGTPPVERSSAASAGSTAALLAGDTVTCSEQARRGKRTSALSLDPTPWGLPRDAELPRALWWGFAPSII
jgi:hypothetical protein